MFGIELAGRRHPGPAGVWLLLPLLACAGNTAPAHFLPAPAEAEQDSYGGWIELTVKEGGRERQVEGELIAVGGDTVRVLQAGGAGVVIPTTLVQKGRLTGYRSSAGAIGGYTLLGTLSTLSNGWFLIFTAPLWIISGSIATGSESGAAMRTTPPRPWADLAEWARFPQGMPEGVALDSLRPKPAEGPAPGKANPKTAGEP
jgi:hypothetical protein